MNHANFRFRLPLVLLFSLLGFGVMGYHPGYEDDEIYLTAVKAALNPTLYPHDAPFFRLQMQATIFDGAMAWLVNLSHLPLSWVMLLVQLGALTLLLWAVLLIAEELFAHPLAQVAALAMTAALLTLPVAGTALLIADQHLHPRNLATALTMAALAALFKQRWWAAIPLLLAALLLHPIMGLFGVTLATLLAAVRSDRLPGTRSLAEAPAVLPISWLFATPGPAWRMAVDTRRYYFLSGWTWYEWLGALAPLALFWLLTLFARRSGNKPLSQTAQAVMLYGLLHQTLAMLVLTPQTLERLAPLQPMRYLQLEYLLMALIAGGLMGQYLLGRKLWRWALFLVVINGSMLLAQVRLFDGSSHFELPWSLPANPWTEAFVWIRQNTPTDAYFALDPVYMSREGENYHGFRALAERSKLSDGIKDTAVVTQVPTLAALWRSQQAALAGWQSFSLADFQGLKSRFGVDWVLVENHQAAALDCRWHNTTLSVCRIP